MKIYISGPMTGIDDFNRPAFNKKAKELREMGFAVINPAEFGEEANKKWHEYMRKDIKAMMDCNLIYLLPGWMQSRGARLELMLAIELGFYVMGPEE